MMCDSCRSSISEKAPKLQDLLGKMCQSEENGFHDVTMQPAHKSISFVINHMSFNTLGTFFATHCVVRLLINTQNDIY